MDRLKREEVIMFTEYIMEVHNIKDFDTVYDTIKIMNGLQSNPRTIEVMNEYFLTKTE